MHRARHSLGLRAGTRFAHALGPLVVQLHEHAYLGAQDLGLKRLDDVVDRAGLVGLVISVELARLCRHEDDRDVPCARARADYPRRLQTVHPGHAHVEQDHRALDVQQRAQRLLPGLGELQRFAERFEHGPQRRQALTVVIDQQDRPGPVRVIRHGASPGPC